MFIIAFVLTILQALTMYSKLSYLFSGIQVLWGLAIVIPSIALSIRRVHDVGRSGWWFLINLVPVVGGIVFLVFTLMASDGANKWGESAKN